MLEDYALPIGGFHGVAHWARVLENGVRVAEESGADVDIVSLFAALHDSRRVSEGYDPDHGQRAADFAVELRGSLFNLSDDQFQILVVACQGHTHERTHADVTVQSCWDADRLDLGRVGITPDPARLCTDVAKRAAMIDWADRRAGLGEVPDFVRDVWGIALRRE